MPHLRYVFPPSWVSFHMCLDRLWFSLFACWLAWKLWYLTHYREAWTASHINLFLLAMISSNQHIHYRANAWLPDKPVITEASKHLLRHTKNSPGLKLWLRLATKTAGGNEILYAKSKSIKTSYLSLCMVSQDLCNLQAYSFTPLEVQFFA